MSGSLREIAFAVPGDITAHTGGTQYDRKLIEALRTSGQPVRLLTLPTGWPAPTPAEEHATLAQLNALPNKMPVIIDGLVFGALAEKDVAALNRPIIVMLHHPLGLETGLPEALAQDLISRERANLRLASHVLVPSEHVASILQEQFDVEPSRLTVARPGFEKPIHAGNTQRQSPPLILSVGLICRRKGHDVLLRALGLIQDLDWQARIVGMVQDPTYNVELERLSTELMLTERVEFLGELSQEALSTQFRRASIFALATRYEGYGMVLSEAQLHGLPVVSCATGAVPETVGSGGLLAPPDDPSAFAKNLRALLEDRVHFSRMAARASYHANSLPTWFTSAKAVVRALDAYAN